MTLTIHEHATWQCHGNGTVPDLLPSWISHCHMGHCRFGAPPNHIQQTYIHNILIYFVDIHVSDLNVYPSGWWFQLSTPLKNDGARQLGLWHSQYIEKTCSKPPAICISRMYLQKSHHVWSTSMCAQGTLRSDRQGAPVLIWPVQRPTAKSAIVVSSPAGGALQACNYPMLSNKN